MATALLHGVPQDFPGLAEAAQLLAAGRRPSTWRSYASKLQRWLDFCQRARIQAVPAKQEHVLCYLGSLYSEGRIHAGSLQPYLSAINSFHADLGLERPALGHAVKLLRRGYGETQAEDDPESIIARRPIPAPVMGAVLKLALTTTNVKVQRDATACVLAFAFMLRADSCLRLRARDVSVSSGGLTLKLAVKTVGREFSVTRTRPGRDEVHAAVSRWFNRAALAPSDLLWRLPATPVSRFKQAALGSWLQSCCSLLKLKPPAGEAWSGHSHRSGGASGALSIDVSLPAIARFGVWSQIHSLYPYLDPSVQPTPDAVLFFDHLLHTTVAAARQQLTRRRSAARLAPKVVSPQGAAIWQI